MHKYPERITTDWANCYELKVAENYHSVFKMVGMFQFGIFCNLPITSNLIYIISSKLVDFSRTIHLLLEKLNTISRSISIITDEVVRLEFYQLSVDGLLQTYFLMIYSKSYKTSLKYTCFAYFLFKATPSPTPHSCALQTNTVEKQKVKRKNTSEVSLSMALSRNSHRLTRSYHGDKHWVEGLSKEPILIYLRKTEQFPPCCNQKEDLWVSACSRCSCHNQQVRCVSAPSPSRCGWTWTLRETHTNDNLTKYNFFLKV